MRYIAALLLTMFAGMVWVGYTMLVRAYVGPWWAPLAVGLTLLYPTAVFWYATTWLMWHDEDDPDSFGV